MNTLFINPNDRNFIVDWNDKKYAANVVDGLLEISGPQIIKATIDQNDVLIISGEEFIRIENSQNYHLVKFEDCSFGDLMHINFQGLDEDFGDAYTYNTFSDYELCLEDDEGNTIPNPKYQEKDFWIRWETKKIEVLDPYDMQLKYMSRPVITNLILVNTEN